MESMRGVGAKIFEFKGLTGKSPKTKELTLFLLRIVSPVTPSRYGAVGGALSQRVSWNLREAVPKWEGKLGWKVKRA
jgi:hypothetical protein